MTFIHTEVYDTNRVHTLAPTGTNMTNPPSTLASLTHIIRLLHRCKCNKVGMPILWVKGHHNCIPVDCLYNHWTYSIQVKLMMRY